MAKHLSKSGFNVTILAEFDTEIKESETLHKYSFPISKKEIFPIDLDKAVKDAGLYHPIQYLYQQLTKLTELFFRNNTELLKDLVGYNFHVATTGLFSVDVMIAKYLHLPHLRYLSHLPEPLISALMEYPSFTSIMFPIMTPG